MKKINKVSVVILSIAFIVGTIGYVRAATLVDLDAASGFAVLAGAAISDTGVSSTIAGSVGLSPTGGNAITVLSCTDVTGTIYDTNGGYTGGHDANIGCRVTNATLLTAAKADVSLAYNDAKTQAQDFAVTASTTDSFAGFPGYVLAPGVYRSGSTMGVPASLTLDGGGDTNAVFIFKAGSTLNTVAGSTISLINGARAGNVFWQVGSSATLGAGSAFEGTIMAAVSITDTGGSTINGRLLADADNTDANSTGAVTLNNTTIIVPATLRIIKTVVNNSGGVATASDFTLHVKLSGTDVAGSPAVGTGAPGTSYSLAAGTYVVSEDSFAGYTATISGNCATNGSITLLAGETKTCTITNDDIAPPPPAPATLRIIKTVVNNSGGVATASDFTLHVKLSGTDVAGSPAAGTGAPGTAYSLVAGTYVVSEDSFAGYTTTISGDCATNGSITLLAGATKTCTITNNDIAPQLIVNKIVINDNGGTKVISNFPLFIDGGSLISGVVTTTTIGIHTVSETTDSGYTSVIGGHCAANGTITLALGDVKTCTVTNDDIEPVVAPPQSSGGSYSAPVPPLIALVKVPSPLVLPDGPGAVNYTYTLSNIGTVPVKDITMVGDTCSPIILISGDTNADAKLGVNETWVYTCSFTLSETHTNIVTAIGWANGISVTDIASATVIVGLPIVPPLIHVIKVPNPLVLSAGGGTVTYTNKVTNPGTVALSNVNLTDDKCGPVKYVSGDTNGNSKLDIIETWTYTCSAKLTKTTVNTVTASGDANGLTARDFAIVTVVVNAAVIADAAVVANVAVPKLPNTGLPPGENNTPWNIILPAGILVILTSLYFARRKQTA